MILSTLLQRATAASLSETEATDSMSALFDDANLSRGVSLPEFYSEERLRLPQRAPRHPEGTLSTFDNLLGANNSEERQHLVRGALHTLGFEWLGYGTFTQLRGRSRPLSFFTSYAHPAWVHRYFTQRYHEVDTRHQDASRSSLPLIWDIDKLGKPQAAGELTARQRYFLDDFRDSGIRSGVFFRIASPTRANEHTVISLMSGTTNRRWITDSVLGRALILSLSVHEYLSRHVHLPGPHAATKAPARNEMSATQQHILEQVQQGRSDKEIAYRLHLSSHAVDYHMRQLRQRFSVRNRVQLVNAALQAH